MGSLYIGKIDNDFSNNAPFYMIDRVLHLSIIWVKIFKNGPGKICGRQP